MNEPKPLIDKKILLEKYPGKGGWTYGRIPEIKKGKDTPFGWVKVRGSIDGYEIKKYHLMPMGNGMLFIPVKASIRKAINKGAGDYVHIVLYPDHEPLDIPEEMLLCLEDEPEVYALHISSRPRINLHLISFIYKKGYVNSSTIVKCSRFQSVSSCIAF
ncbi:MAG: DUF1905 domain-containing protein [Bacteroidetes bacterium]|nr:DUF1905 domain-containing protein [Bacteroidota bacterium]